LNIIGELLLLYRNIHTLTQKSLVERLSHYSGDFLALNTVTLSRWETGATSPSLGKKRQLLNFFASTGCLDKGPCYERVRKCYETLQEPLGSVFTRRYQYLIGNFPDFDFDQHFSIHRLNDAEGRDDSIDHLIDIETMTNVPGYYTVSRSDMKSWCHHPGTFAIVCERKKQHLGHFVMLKIKNDTAEAIAYNWRSELSITEHDLCLPHEQGSYYIHALYGRNPKIAALLNVQAYLHLFDHLRSIDNVVIFSTRKDGVELTKDYGIEMVAKGKDEKFGFQWHGMLSPVEDILFSDTVVKLVF
jgi:transcriptional regulator with XRE-family HTH domain